MSIDFKVSVIVVTYNHGKYIEQALNSIIRQKTSFNVEVIIGDDCSTDDTREKIDSIKETEKIKIKKYYRNKNMGPTKNFYDLCINASGEFIAILEGDDYWSDSNKLSKQIEFLENNTMYCGCSHYVNYIDVNNNIFNCEPAYSEYDNIKIINEIDKFLDNIIEGRSIGHFQSLVFKNIFKKEDLKLKRLITTSNYICDLQIKSLIISEGGLYLLKDNMGVYRFITNTTSFSSLNIEKKYNEMLLSWKAMDEYYNGLYSNKINYIINKNNAYKCIDLIRNKYYRYAFKYLLHINFKAKILFLQYIIWEIFKVIIRKEKRMLR